MTTRRRRATPATAAAEATAAPPEASAEAAAEPATSDAPATSVQPTTDPPGTSDADERAASDDRAAAAAVRAGVPLTTGDTLVLVDESFARFWERVMAFPPERLDEPIERGAWSRKQMLAHIAGWHDLTTERLLALAKNGEQRTYRESDDAINARFMRAAAGRTTGEIVQSVEASYRRLRRQIEMLSDEQLAMHGGWAAERIAGNTFEHYAEHEPDLDPAGANRPAGR